ncbi:unnamed protein product [Bursaphelenchus xylophilus]|uniref:(pine wood nematode) hypothetical protein n=1 Tax=Bursaphelenchus xylophilus TaxID=6326 RepID=A0A811K618_BURXY|nr:unnamed protein product [Bursaphelenchus xylophilus]CAG9087773.1 unnamed protein product [Bursaphelenchus xylophilus]
MEFSVTVAFRIKIMDLQHQDLHLKAKKYIGKIERIGYVRALSDGVTMSPNNVGQASGHRSSPASERQAHSAQAEQLPAVMAPPLVGQHPTGVPEEGKEGSSSTTGPSGFGPEPAPTDQAVEGSMVDLLDFSSTSRFDGSSSTSEEHSTLHSVPSIMSLEAFDENAASEEPLEDQNARIRWQRNFWKEQCRIIWERQATLERKVEFYQEALKEAELEAKKAKEAASAAIKKAEEERALKEEAEKEVSELQARHREHLRTAVADGRPPRAERSRSRSPLMTTAWSITPTTADILRIDVTQPPVTQHSPPPTEAQNHEAPGPLRRMPNCKRRCCLQPSVDPQRPRPHRRSRELQGLGPVLQEEDNGPEEHQRPRRERRPPSRLIVDMSSRSYRTSQESRLPPICPIKTYDKQPRDPVSSKCTQTLVRPAGTRKICPIREQPEHPAPHFIRGPSGILAGARVPSSPCFGQFAAEIRSRSSKTELRGREHPSPLNEPGGLLDRKRVLFPVCGRSRSTPAPHLIRGAFWKINGCSAGPQNMKTGPREERRPGPLNEPGGPLQELKGAIFPLFGQFGTEIR